MSKLYNSFYLDARYYEKDVDVEQMSIKEYRDIISISLPLIVSKQRNTMESIYEAVLLLKKNGLNVFSESSFFYLDLDGKRITPAFKIEDGILNLFEMKYTLLKLDYKSFDRDKLIEILIFFKFISDSVNTITDDMIENVFNQKDYYTNLMPVEIAETKFKSSNTKLNQNKQSQQTIVESVFSLMTSKGYIEVQKGRIFTNKFGNYLQAIKIILTGKKGNSEFIIYLPIAVNGVYSLGTNKFIMNSLVEDYVNNKSTNIFKSMAKTVIDSINYLLRAYYISKGNESIIRHSLQSGINSLLFEQRTIKTYLTKEEKQDEIDRLQLDVRGISIEDHLKSLEFYFSAFTTVETKESSLTDFEVMIEHHKLYYKEYVDPDKATGLNILKNLGKRGYEKHKNFALSNEYLKLFDPTYMNNKADYQVAWLTDTMDSLAELTNPFSYFNKQSFRNAASAYVTGHAFELDNIKPDKPLTKNDVSLVNTLPSYNMWFTFMDYVDQNGLSTYDGQRLLSKQTRLSDSLYEGIKIAFNGLDKGVSRMTDDNLYFIHNGQKIYLNITSMVNMASRLNFGIFFEGTYNAKKYLNGNVETEERNFTKNNLTVDGLLDRQEIFREQAEGDKSLGYHYVGLMQSFFVHSIDSSYKDMDEIESDAPKFKTYKLGSEWFARARLMGANLLVENLIGDENYQQDKINKLISDKKLSKLYGKRGAIVTKVFQKEVIGFSSTVTANSLLKPNEVRIYLTPKEVEPFIEGLKQIEPKVNWDSLKEDLKRTQFADLPPALDLRNPSVDNANTIYAKVKLFITDSKYVKHGYVEINPIIWARQGGDFDGDQIMLLFFKYYLRKELKKHFDYTKHDYHYNFEFKVRDLLNLGSLDIFESNTLHDIQNLVESQFSDVRSYFKWLATIKKNEKQSDSIVNLILDGDKIKHLSKRELIVKASSNLMTTRISKQLIGVSKTITMRALDYIEAAMKHYKIEDQELNNKLMLMADLMNYKLVQPTIDIQKWSDNLNKVIETVLIVYRMSQAVSIMIESSYYPNFRTFKLLQEKDTPTVEFIKTRIELEEIMNKITYQDRFTGELKFGFHTDKADWHYKKDPKLFINEMIEVINPEGEVFKKLYDMTLEDMESVDVNELFFRYKMIK